DEVDDLEVTGNGEQIEDCKISSMPLCSAKEYTSRVLVPLDLLEIMS
ncbi:5427_t:CDS:1, partial [Ambispora gerdemannii]